MIIYHLDPSLAVGLATVIEIPGHVASESGVDDLSSVQVSSVQAEHVTSEVEF